MMYVFYWQVWMNVLRQLKFVDGGRESDFQFICKLPWCCSCMLGVNCQRASQIHVAHSMVQHFDHSTSRIVQVSDDCVRQLRVSADSKKWYRIRKQTRLNPSNNPSFAYIIWTSTPTNLHAWYWLGRTTKSEFVLEHTSDHMKRRQMHA